MKFRILADEWYPVYNIEEVKPDFKKGVTIELTAEEYADFMEACRRFNEWQDKFAAISDPE